MSKEDTQHVGPVLHSDEPAVPQLVDRGRQRAKQVVRESSVALRLRVEFGRVAQSDWAAQCRDAPPEVADESGLEQAQAIPDAERSIDVEELSRRS